MKFEIPQETHTLSAQDQRQLRKYMAAGTLDCTTLYYSLKTDRQWKGGKGPIHKFLEQYKSDNKQAAKQGTLAVTRLELIRAEHDMFLDFELLINNLDIPATKPELVRSANELNVDLENAIKLHQQRKFGGCREELVDILATIDALADLGVTPPSTADLRTEVDRLFPPPPVEVEEAQPQPSV